jgi:hypothetical protein
MKLGGAVDMQKKEYEPTVETAVSDLYKELSQAQQPLGPTLNRCCTKICGIFTRNKEHESIYIGWC